MNDKGARDSYIPARLQALMVPELLLSQLMILKITRLQHKRCFILGTEEQVYESEIINRV